MSNMLDAVLNSTNAILIIFATFAGIASFFTRAPIVRLAAGMIAVLAALVLGISSRSIFAWTVSAVERPSFPGFILLSVLAVSAVTGLRVTKIPEFRFATAVLAFSGSVLYPAATGFLNKDAYIIGYSGYILPMCTAVVIGIALYRGYLVSAFALNVGIASFLLGFGVSRNLWDYLMDPVAWIIGCGTWIAIASGLLMARTKAEKTLTADQPSAGIGETPISH